MAFDGLYLYIHTMPLGLSLFITAMAVWPHTAMRNKGDMTTMREIGGLQGLGGRIWDVRFLVLL